MQAIQDTLKPTYASILKNNTNVASNSINQNTNPTGERPTLQQKLQSFTSKHSRSRSKSPTRKASKTNQQNQSNEIAALKGEIAELKQKQNSKSTEAKTCEASNSTSTGKSRITECYNIHRRNHGNLRKTIEKSIRHQSDPNGNIINLTKHSFTKVEYKLLSKNLNFISTPKVYKKNELEADLTDFFRGMKLKAYFKDTPNGENNDENRLLKQNKNKKWTPPNNYHYNKHIRRSSQKRYQAKRNSSTKKDKIQFK